MNGRLQKVFHECSQQKRPAFVAYLMAGFQTREETVPTMLALQEGGADVIELGIPFTDPIADGPTIQIANQKALENKVCMTDVLDFVRRSREAGLKVPLVLMGYYNPVVAYGEEELVRDAAEAGADGFIIVDLPPEEAEILRGYCKQYGMSYIPLVCPTTSDVRVKQLTGLADSFVYCISMNGITGERAELPEHLPHFINRVRKFTTLPLAVGFGIGNRRHFELAGQFADGVVIGSAIIKAIASTSAVGDHSADDGGGGQVSRARAFAESITLRRSSPVLKA